MRGGFECQAKETKFSSLGLRTLNFPLSDVIHHPSVIIASPVVSGQTSSEQSWKKMECVDDRGHQCVSRWPKWILGQDPVGLLFLQMSGFSVFPVSNSGATPSSLSTKPPSLSPFIILRRHQWW